MSHNSFGNLFRITSFGESHGPALGVIVDGCPSGLEFDMELVRLNLSRRRPGKNPWESPRSEPDEFEVLSGVYEGKTLGTPIALVVRNQDARSGDYTDLKPRVGHADDVWQNKFGHVDPRGGGRASGRETLTRVLAGSVAQMLCTHLCKDLQVVAGLQQLGPDYKILDAEMAEILKTHAPGQIDAYVARYPKAEIRQDLIKSFENLVESGNSWGAQICCLIKNPPPNLGEPVFNKIKQRLAAALMSIGAVRAVELGLSPEREGQKFHVDQTSPIYGGVRGGISTGQDIFLKADIKPTSSIGLVAKKGRHDPCIASRAVPVVESMVYLVLADLLLARQSNQLSQLRVF